MTAFLLYIARSGLYVGVFYVFFLLIMRRTKEFRLNRLILFTGSYLCLLFPLIRFRTAAVPGLNSDISVLPASIEATGTLNQETFSWEIFLMILYTVGVLAILTVYLVNAWKMRKLIIGGELTEQDGCRLILLDEDIPSFSWGRIVVMSREDYFTNPAIYTHELIHIHRHHSRDLLLYLPIHLLLWWNPLVWITREELLLLHEFDADEGVLNQGIDAADYQLLLVRKAAGDHRFSLASEFRHAELKKRIKMMLKPKSSSRVLWLYLASIPVIVSVMSVCNPAKAASGREDSTPNESDTPEIPAQTTVSYRMFYRLPSFHGGEVDEFTRWVNTHLQDMDIKQIIPDLQGSVIAQFTVGPDGAMQNVTVVSGLQEDIDNAVVQAISASPPWEPALDMNGKQVPVSFAITISFQKD